MQNNYRLFLDDIRMPEDVSNYITPVHLRNEFRLHEWVIVRNYDEFVGVIQEKGIPSVVSFDHDLADSHYTPEYLWSDYYKSKEWQEAQVHTEKTGYECAKWMLEHCMENDKPLPACIVHSMNPVGADKIRKILNL